MSLPRVLVVDDSPVVRQTIAVMLSGQFEVMSLDGWSGMAAAIATFTPDVMVIDLNMPGMAGESLIEVVRRFWPKLPIVVFSVESDDRLREAREKHGVLTVGKGDRMGLSSALVEAIRRPTSQ